MKAVFHRLIAENAVANVALFELGPGAHLPLHNHPGMAVFSKLLWGKLQAVTFSRSAQGLSARCDRNILIDADAGGAITPALAGDEAAAGYSSGEDAGAGGVLATLPERGNIHTFRNVGAAPCVVLDILLPPYSPSGGRDASYFKLRPRGELLQSQLPSSSRLPAAFTAHALPWSARPGVEYSLHPLRDGPTDFETFERPYAGPPVTLPLVAGDAEAAATARFAGASGLCTAEAVPEA